MASFLGNAITAAINFDVAGATSSLNSLNGEVSKTTQILQGIGKVGESFTSVGKDLTAKVTLPIVAIGTAAVKTAADFEAAISKVGALSGATGQELELLSAKARELGAATVFSAEEAAEGLQYMALAGWDTNQMLVALEPVLLLAAGAELELGRTSDIVTDAITAFGLEAEDATHFTDVLSQAMTNSNTDLDQLGEAFKYVGPVAGTFGFSIEDVGIALGLMADNGIKGSQAGTSLRRALQNLADPTDAQAKLLEELNVEIFDAEGNANSLDNILRDLRGSFGNLTQEQQAQAASTLFGSQAMGGLLAIINTSEEDYNKLSDAINNADGATKQLYDTQTDNLKGSMAELKSATEELLIAFGELLLPIVRDVVEWLTQLANKISSLDEEQKKQIIKIAGIVAAVGPLLVVIGKVILFVTNLVQAIIQIVTWVAPVVKAIAAFVAGLNPIVLAIAAVIAVLILLWNYCDGFKEFVIDAFIKIRDGIVNAVQAIIQWFKDLPGNIKDAINNTIDNVVQWGKDVKMAFEQWVSDTIDAVIEFFTDLPYKIGYAIGSTVVYILQWGKETYDTFVEWTANTIVAVQVFFQELPGRIWNAINDTFRRIAEWGIKTKQTFTAWVTETIANVIVFFRELPNKIYNAIIDTIDNVKQWGKDLLKTGIIAAIEFSNGLIDTLKDLPDKFLTIGKNIVIGVWNGIAGAAQWFYDQVTGFFSGIVDGAKSALGINSPAKAMIPIGEGVVEGTEVGIDNKEIDLLKASQSISDTIISGAQEASITHTINSSRQGASLNNQSNTSSISNAVKESLMAFIGSSNMISQSNTNTANNTIKTVSSKDQENNNNANIHIEQIIVRNDDDLQKISQGLFNRNVNVLRAQGNT